MLTFIFSQVFCFVFALSGSAVLLDYSTQDSSIQPKIRESMRLLIMNSHHEESKQTLSIIQENIGCCGADGANDYIKLHQPIPNTCRDTVTGNPFFHGCTDELTWFFEEKTIWITGLAMTICFMHVVNVAMAVILMQALRKEKEASDPRNM
ncbi:PREDICTED: uncharacterized protein LOC108565643 [Nicrophorus vespilloides]|uniref:Uncharacterized protein LOC108565643 n=1 Tax=Nicrophorus vespilloides TaxID=110193 RepID=A0ABM1N1J6_NICVS|nr:PREDICTED: uncharacterized protein LOC108565643 [Nicrophorus vespilloides]